MSRLIKSLSAQANNQENGKVISIKYLNQKNEENESMHLASQKILNQANEEADMIKQNAMQEVQQWKQNIEQERQNWEHEKQQLVEEAHREGFSNGIIEGRQSGYQEMTDLLSQAKDIISASKKDYDAYLASSEKTLLTLAISVAKKIIDKKLNEDESVFLPLVQGALKDLKEQKEVQIHVHPTHYPFLLEEKEELLHLFPIEPNLFIFPDEGLSEDACIIETASGRLDASIDTQLLILKEKLLEIMESN